MQKKQEKRLVEEKLEIKTALIPQNNDVYDIIESKTINNSNSTLNKVLQREKTKKINKKTIQPKKRKIKNSNLGRENPISNFLVENSKDSFLITQSAALNSIIKENDFPINDEIPITRMPFLNLFGEKKFLKEKIFEAIEKVKMEKKWLAA